MHRCVPDVVQDLERRDRRRQRLHVAAGRRDDLADRGARGVCTLWPRDGEPREVPVVDFVTGNHQNVLRRGELLRSIHLPAAALSKRSAMRQVSLTKLGRSAALIIATVVAHDGADFLLTVTAATPRPVQLRFAQLPVGRRTAPCPRRPIAAGRLFRRCAWIGPLQAPRHALPRRTDPRGARSGPSMITVNGRSLCGRAGARPVPAHLPARSRRVRRQEGLRRRRLRRLHGVISTASPSIPAWCPRFAAKGREITTIEGLAHERRTASDAEGLSRCAGVSSAAIAPPA